MEKEKIEIKCPNCSGSKLLQDVPVMTFDKGYMYCSTCGLVLALDWVKDTADKLREMNK